LCFGECYVYAVQAESAAAVVVRAESVGGAELIVYSLIEEGDIFRCQIGVFASSVAQCRAVAEAFCSVINNEPE